MSVFRKCHGTTSFCPARRHSLCTILKEWSKKSSWDKDSWFMQVDPCNMCCWYPCVMPRENTMRNAPSAQSKYFKGTGWYLQQIWTEMKFKLEGTPWGDTDPLPGSHTVFFWRLRAKKAHTLSCFGESTRGIFQSTCSGQQENFAKEKKGLYSNAKYWKKEEKAFPAWRFVVVVVVFAFFVRKK